MDSTVAAQWLLSLVSEPKNATSMVGDLEEEASTRGRGWFWWNVFRTAAAHLGRDLHDAPLRMLGFAFWGWSTSWVVAFLLSMVVALLRNRLIGIIPSWEPSVHLTIYLAIAPLLCGWARARQYRHRAVAAAFATVILMAVVQLASVYLSNLQFQRMGQLWPGMERPFQQTLIRSTCFLAGTFLFRTRAATGCHAAR
ncbi:hypothetical protein [Paludibaculum fermentans]|uniref:hypothetical protein n=1 Tax=Paludibaculum fermentans TaxID=1473598 RepID=UPI003EC0229C